MTESGRSGIVHASAGRAAIATLMKSLFGPPPLGPGEDLYLYESKQAQVYADIEPQDVIELMWVRDCVDLETEILSMRRHKPWIINLAHKEALRGVLEAVLTEDDIEQGLDLAKQAAKMADEYYMNPDCRAAIRKFADKYDIDLAATIRARAMVLCSNELDSIDRAVALAERRRDVIIEQIELRREARAKRKGVGIDAWGKSSIATPAPRQLEPPRSETDQHPS
jgi:hypothetical protein